MRFPRLKEIILASGLTIAAAFNTVASAQTNDQAPTPVQTEQTTPADNGYVVKKQTNEDGQIVSIVRYLDGVLNDGPHGEAAIQNFSDNGVQTAAWHYKNGLLNDGINGIPAVQNFSESGAVTYLWHYKNGQLNDASGGVAAVQGFGTDGKIAYVAHYKNGKLSDGVNGEVALQKFNAKGKLTFAARYNNGELTHTLSPSERAQYRKDAAKPPKKTMAPNKPSL